MVTLGLYWALVEAGLALIAACLPSLSPLFTGATYDSVVRRVHSALSLQSLRSRYSHQSSQNGISYRSQAGAYRSMEDDGSVRSHSHGHAVENTISRDLEGGAGPVDDGKIYVMREMTQENIVS